MSTVDSWTSKEKEHWRHSKTRSIINYLNGNRREGSDAATEAAVIFVQSWATWCRKACALSILLGGSEATVFAPLPSQVLFARLSNCSIVLSCKDRNFPPLPITPWAAVAYPPCSGESSVCREDRGTASWWQLVRHI